MDPDAPLLGFIGRLDPQKGVDLIADNYEWLMEQVLGLSLVLAEWVCSSAGECRRACVWADNYARLMEQVRYALLLVRAAFAGVSANCKRGRLSGWDEGAACASCCSKGSLERWRVHCCLQGAQLVLLGSGREDLEGALRWAMHLKPGQAAAGPLNSCWGAVAFGWQCMLKLAEAFGMMLRRVGSGSSRGAYALAALPRLAASVFTSKHT